MAIELNLNFGINPIVDTRFADRNIALSVLRLDQIHPIVSGNKWFKLKEYISKVLQGDYRGILTFGGAYSNHLVATAAACNYYQIPCVGLVRGLELKDKLNDTLTHCSDLDMQLDFLTRAAYKEKDSLSLLQEIKEKYPNYLIIPEGGYGRYGILGAQQISQYIPDDVDTICLPVGSGTTFCGIIEGAHTEQQVIGFAALKQGAYLEDTIAENTNKKNWQLKTGYHFGGFGKHQPELIQFIKQFKLVHQIELDFVYTAKMMCGLYDCIEKEDWSNRNILCLHTGGLQGNNSIRHLLS